MTGESLSNLEERLETAALLPEHDPERAAAEAAARAAGLEPTWLALVADSAGWRAQLTPPTDDAELVRVLLAVPQRRRPLALWSAVAAAVAACVLLWAAAFAPRGGGDGERLRGIASHALANHVKGADSGWIAGDEPAIEDALSAALGFVVVLPELLAAAEAGRRCSLDERPVAWVKGVAANHERCSLFQFHPADFELRKDFASETVLLQSADGAPFELRLWAESARGYVLVLPR